MIVIKSPREISLMREAGRVVAVVFEKIKPYMVPGVSTKTISDMVEKIMEEEGAISAEKGYGGYPEYACVSVNEVLVHGIPSDRKILKDGDIVSLDIVAKKNGYMGDACRTYPIGICGERQLRMIHIAETCFFEGVRLIRPGVHLGDIQHRIQEVATSYGVKVAREFTGHGIGSHMHEDPVIPNYGEKGSGPVLAEGMTLAIEPMILEGKGELRILKDGWTAVSKDGKLTAHYENTIVVTKDGYDILTMLEEEKIRRKLV